MKIAKVGIILKHGSELPRQIGAEIAAWFAARGVASETDCISADMDILVILGGDGTLLHVAEQAAHFQIPVVGVNLGSLGFLTEIAVKERFEALEQIMAGVMLVEDRLMLKSRLWNKNGEGEWRYALNDVVISKGNEDRLLRLEVWADGKFLNSYKADGLIFSTPTGSTAYNLSAGGPIVHPAVRATLVTPICPFMLESRPVLLPDTSNLLVKIAGLGHASKVILDGRPTWDMGEEHQLEVGVATNPLRLICPPGKGYFEILRRKLNWGGRPIPD
ncbi:MAG: NAD(+)/NADH kinase [Desulfobulbaceae bacterium]|nr:NAD(+)/NADH kinase [Desulfobulbaceae bacterium]